MFSYKDTAVHSSSISMYVFVYLYVFVDFFHNFYSKNKFVYSPNFAFFILPLSLLFALFFLDLSFLDLVLSFPASTVKRMRKIVKVKLNQIQIS